MRERDRTASFSWRREPWLLAVPAMLLCAVMAYAFLSEVEPDEAVVKDCGGGDVTVWRGYDEPGIHWDGFCRTATYREQLRSPFSERVQVGGLAVIVRGTVRIDAPAHDDDLVAAYLAYGSEDRLLEAVWPGIMADIDAAAAEPAWHRPQGGVVKRELKTALEYGLKRLSPTGGIWTSPEARQALEQDIQRRLDARIFPPGVEAKVELGFLTER